MAVMQKPMFAKSMLSKIREDPSVFLDFPKTVWSWHPRIQESKNPGIRESKNPRIRESWSFCSRSWWFRILHLASRSIENDGLPVIFQVDNKTSVAAQRNNKCQISLTQPPTHPGPSKQKHPDTPIWDSSPMWFCGFGCLWIGWSGKKMNQQLLKNLNQMRNKVNGINNRETELN